MEWYSSGESLHGESVAVIFLIVAGVIANLPVLIVYTKSKHIRSITDKFLLNLLVADIVALTLLLPSILISFIHYSSLVNEHNGSSNIYSHAEESIPGAPLNYFNTTFDSVKPYSHSPSDGLLQTFYWKWSCTINKGLISGVATASVIAALEIALERYLAVVTPLHYHKLLTTPSISFVSASGGLISLASFLISAFDPSQFQFPACNLRLPKTTTVGGRILQSSLINQTFTESHNKLEDAFHSSRNSDDGHNPFEYDEDSSFRSTDEGLSSSEMSMKHTEQLIWAIFNLIHIFLVFLLPVILMSYIYVRIFLEARRQKIRMTQRYKPYFLPGNPSQLNPFDSSAEFKGKTSRFDPIFVRFRLMDRFRPPRLDRALRVAVFAVVVSVLCWTPYYIVRASNAIKTIMAVSGSRVSLNPHETNEDEETQLQSLLSLGKRLSPVLSNEMSKWNSVYPLLFASLHPLLASVFYAYRYKRLRLEILRVICDTFSICGRQDQRNASAASCATSSSHLNNGRLSSSSTCGGSPCIRQTIAIPEGVCRVTSTNVNKSASEANGTQLTSTNRLGVERDVPQIVISSGDSPTAVQLPESSSETKHSSISIRIDSVEADESPRDLICLPCEQRGECHLGMRRVEIPSDDGSSESVVRMERSMGTFVNCLTVWMNSYSRRWLQHRESVTSTASFITLLSSKYHNKAHPVANV